MKNLKQMLIENDKFIKENINILSNFEYMYAIKQDKFDVKIYWLKKSADRDNLNAILDLAKHYYDTIQYDESFEWYSKGATLNNNICQYNLSNMFKNGQGIEQDDELYLFWLKKSADNNYEQALTEMGDIYYDGFYINKDLEKAFECYKKAADKNFLPACLNLSIMYFEGQGTKKDLNNGYNYLSIAYNSSYQPAIGVFEKYKKQILIV